METLKLAVSGDITLVVGTALHSPSQPIDTDVSAHFFCQLRHPQSSKSCLAHYAQTSFLERVYYEERFDA